MNHFRKNFPEKNSESGVTLVFIIIAMTVIAALGVGLYTLTMTSAFNQVEAQKAAKAYYISESCVRIAASEYKAAAAANKNSTLVALHNKNFTMPNNQGSCTVSIYPYWFYAYGSATYDVGETSITLYLPGVAPPVDQDGNTAIAFPTAVNGKLKKKGTGGEVYSFSGAVFGDFDSVKGTAVEFTLSTALTSALTIADGDEFYLGYPYATVAVNGEDLDLTSTDASMVQIFPPQKGFIFQDAANSCSIGETPVTEAVRYSYTNRVINGTSVKLTKFKYEGSCPSVNPTTGNSVVVYIGKSIGFKSTATYVD